MWARHSFQLVTSFWVFFDVQVPATVPACGRAQTLAVGQVKAGQIHPEASRALGVGPGQNVWLTSIGRKACPLPVNLPMLPTSSSIRSAALIGLRTTTLALRCTCIHQDSARGALAPVSPQKVCELRVITTAEGTVLDNLHSSEAMTSGLSGRC